ncbi:MAG: phosphopantetheine-binding protein, partial [Polaromonas sp.]
MVTTDTHQTLGGELQLGPLLLIVERTLRDLQADAPVALRVTLNSSLDRDLALDSLARMELLLRIERAFGVALPEDTLARAETVRDLLSAVQRVLRASSPERRGAEALPGLAPRLASSGETVSGVPLGATTLLEVLDWHVRAHPDQTQIVLLSDDTQQRISYRRLAAGADAIAGGLQRAGLQPRQTVAIMLPTSPE